THHEHDDLGRRHTEGLRQVAHRHARLDGHGSGRRDDLARCLRARRLTVTLLLSCVARTGCGVVDDNASLAPLARTTLTWPHRPGHAAAGVSSTSRDADACSPGTPAGTWSGSVPSAASRPRSPSSSEIAVMLSGPMLSASGEAVSASASSSGSASVTIGSTS